VDGENYPIETKAIKPIEFNEKFGTTFLNPKNLKEPSE
jgi:hypothetical protein